MFHIFNLVRNPSQRTFKRIPIWWHHEASQCFGTNFGHEIIEIECLKAQIINFVKWAMLKQSSKSYSKYSKHKTIAKTLQTIHKRFANAWRHEATLWHRHLLLNYRYQVTKKITKLNFFYKRTLLRKQRRIQFWSLIRLNLNDKSLVLRERLSTAETIITRTIATIQR